MIDFKLGNTKASCMMALIVLMHASFTSIERLSAIKSSSSKLEYLGHICSLPVFYSLIVFIDQVIY